MMSEKRPLRATPPIQQAWHILLLTLLLAASLCMTAGLDPVHAAAKPGKPGKITVTPQDASCQITWKSVKRAKTYTIQYKKASAKKWKTAGTTANPFWELTGLKADTKYQTRVRAVNGKKKGNWSARKTFTTKLVRPIAVWPTYIDAHSITIQWVPSAKAKKYQIIWYQDNPDAGELPVVTKDHSYTFDSLECAASYTFLVKAINGKKASPAAEITLGTYNEDIDLIMEVNYNTPAPRVSLTRFISGYNHTPGDERKLPVLYGSHTFADEDDGFYFPDVDLQRAILYYGDFEQANPSDPAKPYTGTITGETTFQVGESITLPSGESGEITSLKMEVLPHSNFASTAEAYEGVSEFLLAVYTDAASSPLQISWTAWK